MTERRSEMVELLHMAHDVTGNCEECLRPASEAILSTATATQSAGARRVRDWVQLIRQQFQQTPHLCVTAEQASRLWGLEKAEIEAVLSAFVDAHLLDRTRGGAYMLRLDPPSRSVHWPSC